MTSPNVQLNKFWEMAWSLQPSTGQLEPDMSNTIAWAIDIDFLEVLILPLTIEKASWENLVLILKLIVSLNIDWETIGIG